MKHEAALLEPLRDQWRALGTALPAADPSFVLLDEEFHITLMQASGNDELTESLREGIAAEDGPRLVQARVASGMWME